MIKKFKCISCLDVIESHNFPDICVECGAEGAEKFVEVPSDAVKEPVKDVEPETPVAPEPVVKPQIAVAETPSTENNAIGFRASPTIIKKLFEAISIPLSSKRSYFNKVVLQKDEEKIVSAMTANGNTFLTVGEFHNDFFKNNWGFGKVAINSSKALDIVKHLRHYENLNFHHDLESKVLLFHIGEKDRMSMLAEDVNSVSGYNPNVYSKINKDELIMPIPQDENTVQFDVATGTLNHLVERSASEGSIIFNLGANGVKAGVGDIDNPIDTSYALDIEAINYKPPEKPYSITIGEPFFDVLKIEMQMHLFISISLEMEALCA